MKKTLNMLIKSIKPHWFKYTTGLLFTSCINLVFNYAAAISLKWLTDASVNKDMNALVKSVISFGGCILLIAVIIPFFMYAFDSSVKRVTGDIRKMLFDHIQSLPVKNIEDSHSADFISRLTNDVQTFENAYGGQISQVLSSLISGIGSIAIMSSMNIKLSIVGILIGLLTTCINILFIKPLKKVSDEVQNSLSQMTQKYADTLSGNSIVKMFNLYEYVQYRFNNSNSDIRKWSMRRVSLNTYLWGINDFLGFGNFVGVVSFGCYLSLKGETTFGTIIAVSQMLNGVTWMFNSIGNYLTQLQGSLAGGDRIREILDMPVEENSLSLHSTEEYNERNDAVIFKNINFSYNTNNEVLNNLNLYLKKGEVLAVVGPSGSGKSTLFKMLLGFYKPESGDIIVNGHSISDLPVDTLRKNFAYVPQGSYLFSGTIAENIGYGKNGASPDEIINAAKAAYAHDFIIELPEGYDTPVGERGTHLSGGQRQRIAIARAFLKDAPILLLDEATSSLDSESELQVQKALEVLMKNRTTMVVAHRLSTIQYADRIVVLKDGKIVEEGNHTSLIQQDSFYSYLYNIQFQE